jgi:hypothetical protein
LLGSVGLWQADHMLVRAVVQAVQLGAGPAGVVIPAVAGQVDILATVVVVHLMWVVHAAKAAAGLAYLAKVPMVQQLVPVLKPELGAGAGEAVVSLNLEIITVVVAEVRASLMAVHTAAGRRMSPPSVEQEAVVQFVLYGLE